MKAGRVLSAVHQWWRARQLVWFRPRQIILRDGDAIHSINICSRVQKIAAGVVLGGLGFTGAMTAGYAVQTYALVDKQAEVERARTAYHELIDEVAGQQDKVNGITRDLEHYRAALIEVLQHNERMSSDLQQMTRRLDVERNEKKTIAEQEKALRDQLQGIERDLGNVSERNDYLQLDMGALRERLAGSEADKVKVSAARTALERRLNRLEEELAQAQGRAGELETQIAARQAALDSANAQRRAAVVERDATARRAAQIEERMADLRKQHEEMVGRLADRTRVALGELERVVRETGLDPQRFQPRKLPVAAPAPAAATPSSVAPLAPPAATPPTERMPGEVEGVGSEQGTGGPFVPPPTENAPAPVTPAAAQSGNLLLSLPDLSDKTARIESDLARLEAMRRIVATMPLTVPLNGYRVMSPFGVRSDPFSDRRAYHEGIDLSAPMMTSIRVTAPGKVTFAGWNGAYGRMVEVNHGNGFVTRYAHLATIQVTDGQVLNRRDPVGLLGTSGRSSGPHVHYEVLINGQHVNPARFMKVPLHVH